MKKKIVQFLPVLSVIVIVSCNNDVKTNDNDKKPINKTPLTTLLVPDSTVTKDIRTFDSLSKAHGFDSINAYTIRAEELIAAMGIDPNSIKPDTSNSFKKIFTHVRVYPAYRAGAFKLYVVPVEGADLSASPQKGGYDMVFDKNGKILRRKSGKFALRGADGDNGYEMDLIAPCPNVCPENN
jgi:hypothetical protein